MSEPVVSGTAGIVRQYLVRFVDLLEALLRLLRRVQVRVVLPRQPPVRAANVVAGGRSIDLQNLIVVAFASHGVLRHVRPTPSSWTAVKTNQSAGSRVARGDGIEMPRRGRSWARRFLCRPTLH